MDFLYSFIAFLIAFFISTTEIGIKEYPNTYPILFKVSRAYYIYGIIYGFLAVIFYFLIPLIFQDKIGIQYVSEEFIAAFIAGFSIRALTKISLYDITLDKKNKISIGTGIITDIIDKILTDKIEIEHDNYLTSFAKKIERDELKDKSLDEIKHELTHYLPLKLENLNKQAAIKNISKQKSINLVIIHFILYYGLSRFKNYIRNIEK